MRAQVSKITDILVASARAIPDVDAPSDEGWTIDN